MGDIIVAELFVVFDTDIHLLDAFSVADSGGLWNAVLSTIEIGGSAFALFLRSQRTWNCKPLDDNDAELFKKTLKVSLFMSTVAHRRKIFLVLTHLISPPGSNSLRSGLKF